MRTGIRRMSGFALAGVAAMLVAAPVPARAQVRSSCSSIGQILFVRDAMHELYYWYHQLPNPRPTSFSSPEQYLEAVRYRPLDTTFSYIGLRAAEDAFYSDSQFIGFGLSTRLADAEMRISQVFPDSPAAEAGLARGQSILQINGRSIAELIETGAISSAFGPSEEGVQATIVFRIADGSLVETTMTKRLVTIPTVSYASTFDLDGRKVGYLMFRNFVRPSVDALNQAFDQFVADGARELVLDLRYNGGGLVSVAQHLSSLIGGALTDGQIFTTFVHNDKNAWRNQDFRFEGKPNALNLSRLIVITTKASASASELVINSLRPFIPVVVIGSPSYGKPVGQYGLNFCDKVLYPVAFATRNALDQGDYFDGFAPDCPAEDDLDHAFGDPAETSLAEALTFARTDACSPPRAETARLRRVWRDPMPKVGLLQLIGAY